MPVVEKQWWDPYETSQRRDYIYRPISSTLVLRPPTSQAYKNSVSLSEPVGSTAYNEDFRPKPASKPDCIRTGSASGNRRNNPHPSQSFMVWRLPKGVKQSSTDGSVPRKNPLSEEEIRNVLTAQYRSTYRTDFLGMPQGLKPINHGLLAPLSSRQQNVPHSIHTEMRNNYRLPRQRSELQGNTSRYGCNALHEVAPKGIVPAVVHGHIRNQEKRSQLTTYDSYFAGKNSDVTALLKSLQPKELQHFCKHLPEKDKMVVQTFLSKEAIPNQTKKGKNTPNFPCSSSKPEWMSRWPGPL
ncbi:testis-expressed protein 26 [Aplochiton taeniatus]